MEYIREILARNILSLRKETGQTQSTVAQAIGSTVASYSRWENGINWPDPESIEKLASFYKVPSSRLFYDEALDRPETPALDPQNELLLEIQKVLNKYKS